MKKIICLLFAVFLVLAVSPMSYAAETGALFDAVAITSVNVYYTSYAPFYPGTQVQLKARVSGTGIVDGAPESTLYWYVRGNTSVDTYLAERSGDTAVLYIASNEASSELEIEVISTYDSTKSASVIVPVTSPLVSSPDQNDKADQMQGAIGEAAGKLENNNGAIEQLTPTRPQINTNLQFDQEQMLAVSPLVTNIWNINGLGRMISIVLVVATVAYIFFGKRDG